MTNQLSNLKEENEQLKNQLGDCENETNNSELNSSTDLSTKWEFVENTNLQAANGDNIISGTIDNGFIFKTLSGSYY